MRSLASTRQRTAPVRARAPEAGHQRSATRWRLLGPRQGEWAHRARCARAIDWQVPEGCRREVFPMLHCARTTRHAPDAFQMRWAWSERSKARRWRSLPEGRRRPRPERTRFPPEGPAPDPGLESLPPHRRPEPRSQAKPPRFGSTADPAMRRCLPHLCRRRSRLGQTPEPRSRRGGERGGGRGCAESVA